MDDDNEMTEIIYPHQLTPDIVKHFEEVEKRMGRGPPRRFASVYSRALKEWVLIGWTEIRKAI